MFEVDQAGLDDLKEFQDSLLMTLRGLTEPGWVGILGKATLRAHAYASKIVHVVTGRLKNSLFPRVVGSGNNAYGSVMTNVAYAGAEHDRGGEHAFFERTIDEDGPGIVEMVDRDVGDVVRSA